MAEEPAAPDAAAAAPEEQQQPEQSVPLAPVGPPPPPHGLPIAARPRGWKIEGGDAQEGADKSEANARAMAWYLGMNLILDEAHMGIAEAALAAELPEGWAEEMDADGRTYYWQAEGPLAGAQWEHPADAGFRRQLLEARCAGRADGIDAPTAEAPLPGMFRPPPGEATVEELAEYLGMDLTVDRGLLWVADAALAAGMPDGWSMHESLNGPPFFHNDHFGITQWEHPTDQFFRSMYLSEKAKLEGGEESAAPGPRLARPMPRTMLTDPAALVPSPPKPFRGDKSMAFGGGDPEAAENFSRLKKVSPFGVLEPRRVRANRRAPSEAPTELGPLDSLHVRIVEARQLKPMDTFGLSDPLVAVSHTGPQGVRERRSPAVRRTLNPTFVGATFSFQATPDLSPDSPEEERQDGWGKLELKVFDEAPAAPSKGRLKAKEGKHPATCLGVAALDLAAELTASGATGGFAMDRWVQLEGVDGAAGQGEVHVMVTLIPAGSTVAVVEEQEEEEPQTEYTETDVRDMAVYLGMNPLTDEHLFWLAEEALTASLPVGWKPKLSEGAPPVFVETRSGLESSEHPMDPCFRNIFFREKEAERLFEENEWEAVQAEAAMLQAAMLAELPQEEEEQAAAEEGAALPEVAVRGERDETWKRVATVPVEALVDLVFTTVDSNANGVLSHKELALSAFGESLLAHWDALDADSDAQVTKDEYTQFFASLKEKMGEDEYHIFVVDLVWHADVDVSHLVPSAAEGESSDDGLGEITAEWEESQVLGAAPDEAEEWAETFVDGGEDVEAPPEPINAVALLYMAKYFGIELGEPSAHGSWEACELLSLVQQAVCAALPENVVERRNAESGEIEWLDTMTNQVMSSHPFEAGTKERLPALKAEIATSRTDRGERLKTIATLDSDAAELPAEVIAQYQRVVGAPELLGPDPAGETEGWCSWPVRIAGTAPQPWAPLVQPDGGRFYQRLGAVDDAVATTASPFDWPSLDEVTMQLHWYYRLHSGGASGAELRGNIVRQKPKRRGKAKAHPLSGSSASGWSPHAQRATSRTSELATPKEVVSKSEASFTGVAKAPSSAAERKAAKKARAKVVWCHRAPDSVIEEWLRQGVRQGHFHSDTQLIDAGRYAAYVERLQSRLMKDEMQYGSGDARVEQGAQLLVMMCNLLAQRWMACKRYIPALQLLKQAEQASDPAVGYPFPARQQCRAWTLDSLAYYYEKRGKHRGAASYLQKAFAALVAESEGLETPPSPFRGVDILLHTGYVAAKVGALRFSTFARGLSLRYFSCADASALFLCSDVQL